MSDYNETAEPRGSNTGTGGPAEKVGAAQQEAADLMQTSTEQAKDLLETGKEEAGAVVGEAKVQVQELYAQTKQELKDQADTQQQRLAGGLRSVSDELTSMASNSDGSGVAADLVRQASTRISSAATWLGERDASGVLSEVKRYARRKPGMFILAAAVVGVAAGRLTRALATNASEQKGAPTTAAPRPAPAPRQVIPEPGAAVPVGGSTRPDAGTPLYTQIASDRPDSMGGDADDRPHSL